MLSNSEIEKIIDWQPYRDSWNINRNINNDYKFYKDILKEIQNYNEFQIHIDQDGGNSNYLGIFIFPKIGKIRKSSILLNVSLCAPICCMGEIEIGITSGSFSYNWIKVNQINVIKDIKLKNIEKKLIQLMNRYEIELLNSNFLGKLIDPMKHTNLIENLNNLNEENNLLNALFQVID